MDLRLKDKVAIVTGAGGGGMGTDICLELAREGTKVVCNDIDPSWADKVATQVAELGGESLATYTDVTGPEACEDMVKKTIDKFGRVDILVTVPFFAALKPFIQGTVDEWQKTMDVTFWGVIYAVKAVLPNMLEQKGGSIVCIGSDAMKVGEPTQSIYGGAKAAVGSFVKSVATEVGRAGVRLNVVSPGTTRTPGFIRSNWLTEDQTKALLKRYPLRRFAEPQEVADVVTFLASDRASYVTGQVISVSGGYTMQ